MQIFTFVDATLTEKKNLFLRIRCKKYWKNEKILEKSGKFESEKVGSMLIVQLNGCIQYNCGT